MQKRKNEGLSTKERISKLQRFNAGNLVKAGTNRLGKDVHKLMVERRMEKERLEKMKLDALSDD